MQPPHEHFEIGITCIICIKLICMSKQLPVLITSLIFLSISVSAQNYNMGNSSISACAGNFFRQWRKWSAVLGQRKFCDDHCSSTSDNV